MVYRDVFKAMLFRVHVTTEGGPKDEMNVRVKTGGSASRVEMRANVMLPTIGPAEEKCTC